MADKPEFVDLISEATRQNRRRTMPVDIDPMPSAARQGTSRMAHTAAAAGALAAGDADAVEDQAQVLEIRDLGLVREAGFQAHPQTPLVMPGLVPGIHVFRAV